jgi:histidinol-phosphatase
VTVDLAADLDLALRLADAADAITLPRFRAADLRVDRKPDRTPVTDADTAAESALRAILADERPGDAVLGEEGGGAVATGGRGWVLDPIDGTKNFSRGVPAWGTLIALTEDGRPTVGVASCPALGRRWWGATGLGAWTTDAPLGVTVPRRLAVSGVSDLADAYVSTTDYRSFTGDGWSRLAAEVWETRAFGDLWHHCLVAEGVIDVAVEALANPWDLAAVMPIVEEAGGRLTSLDGEPTFAAGDGFCSNGLLHDAVLARLRG